jgi:hypothetical protein
VCAFILFKKRCTGVGCGLCGSSKHEKARRTEVTRTREKIMNTKTCETIGSNALLRGLPKAGCVHLFYLKNVVRE